MPGKTSGNYRDAYASARGIAAVWHSIGSSGNARVSFADGDGQSVGAWALVLFLLAQPVMLVAAVTAGFLCYRRLTKWRFVTALALPALHLLGMRILMLAL
ncbi:hypothetical protein [Sphingomonas sp. PvP018]|uniref:hypothetical protein n=1 Tax=Sphingomonas sp. PvP018 TaxID=2817852 RepID=UPI001AE2D0EC|nr:hypothetical protein [Sphingomonas sp. PvP018]MBP2512649.1 hypothetical protein [Sphingomonas sp. PvP018]